MEQAAQSRVTTPSSSLIPSGTVTFLFTDIEGSTERWETHRAGMKSALARHDEILSAAIAANGGYVFKRMGDAYCAAFRTAPEALRAAIDAQLALGKEDFSSVNGLRVRIALHAGYADEREGDYFGPTVNRVARLLAIGHGGQVLVSAAASDLARGDLPLGASLRELGSHRLKDLAHPEEVFQLVADGLTAEFPPLRSLESLPNNLPLQVTSFLGRDEDVAEVKQLLGKTRLLTLAGMGGVGKTRLALQVGAELLDQHPDGVWFVDLAGLQDPDLVVSETASILSVRVGAERSLSDSIIYALKPKRVLLILDNCEHLVEAAAQMTSAIIKGAPQVRVLTTSREGLGIAGEAIHRVLPLAVPKSSTGITAEAAKQFGAVALFVDRATAANTRFTLSDADAATVVDICRALDGIPFAIELAAARVKAMSVTNLGERLSERFRILTGGDRTALPRHQTLRALIDWSYNLLNERERTILNRASVFAGGWTIDAASDICADETIESWEVLDLISSLVDKSLVVAELGGASERFRMLDSTWRYALEKLGEAGESERVNRKHAEYFLTVAQAADDAWESTPSKNLFAQMEPELDNFRAAMDWALVKRNDVALGRAMAAALRELWIRIGSRAEGIRWVNLALEADPDAKADPVTVRLWLGYVINNQGEGALAHEAAIRALAQAEELGDAKLLALAHVQLAFALDRRGRYPEAEAEYIKAVPLLRQTNNTKKLASCLSWWGILHWVRGEAEQAQKCFAEAIAIAKSFGDDQMTATIMGNVAELTFSQGDAKKAVAVGDEALEMRRQSKNPGTIANALANLAAYRLALGDVEGARANGREGILLGRDAQDSLQISWVMQHLAIIGAQQGQEDTAARLLGYVDELMRKSEWQREPTEQWSYEKLLASLHEHLDDSQIAKLRAEGTDWSEEQAIAAALTL
ncbi:MAG: tetratricopeptide repeat protein [Candidatus Eremiobacteraeota bacterium]|nr:tetratricopeptide repeat protein [Candidatus Eremiobacteraeota bacterium]